SYSGLHSEQRLAKPMIKKDGHWQESEWQEALEYTVKQLQQVITKQGAAQLGVLTSPNATTEACYLLQKLSRAIGCPNIDHRVQQTDFADQASAPLFYGSQIPYADLEKQQAILLIGSNLAQEQPLAAVRVRKAALQGAKVMAMNPIDYCFNFDSAEKVICSPTALPSELAQVVKALSGENLPSGADKLLADIQASEIGKAIAQQLQAVEKAVIVLGALAMNHPQAALIRSLVQLLAKSSGAEIIYMTQGANSAGATLAGAVPHRLVGGKVSSQVGLDAHAMLQKKLKAYLLLDLEPELDCADPHRALLAMQQAEFVVCLSAFQTPTMADYADVILPIAAFSEDAGTYVNVEGQWQSFTAAVKPYEQARPAWKILRVLANLLEVPGFDYNHSAEIKADVEAQLAETIFKPQDGYDPQVMTNPEQGLTRIGEWMMYGSDGLVRRAQALQDSAANVPIAARFSPQTAEQYNLSAGDTVKLGQHEQTIELPVIIDERLAVGCVCLPCGLTATMNLGASFAQVEVK
ncbi:MAG: molybdopterin-dependent oxidoreductase, partial [Gammaproteobacteria bacterium]